MDSFFKQRFNAAKCKTLLKLTIPRIKLLRNRREIQLKQMRKEIAKLLETGQEATARIRVEHIIREEKMMAAQEIVELFCELIAVRLPIIEAQRECPLDLKEAISSVCFAAPRCADLPELLQVQILFAGKYGKEFVSAATELMPECGVNRQLIELLSIRAPAPDVKLKLLKEIAEEYELDWDPSTSESALLKPHEDLLNGPSQFVRGSKLSLPTEKHDETTTAEPAAHEHSDSDADFDIIDFPEVPKQPLQSNKGSVSAPEMLPFPASALSDVDDEEEPNPSGGNKNLSNLGPEDVMPENSATKEDTSPKISASPVGDEQFVPFISPPSQSPASFPVREHSSPPAIPKTKNVSVDLQDVLAAAQAAAETAERAAAAARSAASIAQLRISELVRNKNDGVSVPTVENPFHLDKSKSDVAEKADLLKHKSTGDSNSASTSPNQNESYEHYTTQMATAHPSHYDPQVAAGSSSPGSNVLSQGAGHHQPQRLPSLDDETYFSYPNLFTPQGSNVGPHTQSSTDSK
ncbi:ist1 [Sesamum alatum]|uniref:Ist1 n=1 Tax=Sesamum alatum TaxID=300844 RepID=A0AAE2CNB4_9LAMI|nr:ist1 [Sesamum alatum]